MSQNSFAAVFAELSNWVWCVPRNGSFGL